MGIPPQQSSIIDAEEETCRLVTHQLEGVFKALKEARKFLRRDYEHPALRERSARSRIVKETVVTRAKRDE